MSGNTLYVANCAFGNTGTGTVGAYDATTRAAINSNFITVLSYRYCLAVSGNSLLVANGDFGY